MNLMGLFQLALLKAPIIKDGREGHLEGRRAGGGCSECWADPDVKQLFR